VQQHFQTGGRSRIRAAQPAHGAGARKHVQPHGGRGVLRVYGVQPGNEVEHEIGVARQRQQFPATRDRRQVVARDPAAEGRDRDERHRKYVQRVMRLWPVAVCRRDQG